MSKLKGILLATRRYFHVDQEGKIGANLPFQIKNKPRMIVTLSLGIGLFFNFPIFLTYYNLNEQGMSKRGDVQEPVYDGDDDDEEEECED